VLVRVQELLYFVEAQMRTLQLLLALDGGIGVA
jgi:hypothetical protein